MFNSKFEKEYSDYIYPDGAGVLFRFENNYGASVIDWGYGDEEHPYELAVVKFDGDDWDFDDDTPITDDVLGFLTDEDVSDYLSQIKKLESN